MKAGIAGAGSLGSLFAHYFNDHLIDFAIYEKDKEICDSITGSGLTLKKNGTERKINPEISQSPGILSDADAVFLFVKSYSTADAMSDIKYYLKSDAIVVSLQNGLGNFEEIKEFISEERIVYGTTTIGAAKESPGVVAAGGAGIINIGGSGNANVMRVHHLLNSADLNSYIVEDPGSIIWHKAIINAGINPVAAILDIPNGEIPRNRYASELQESIIREAVSSAVANGFSFDYIEMISTTRDVCEKTAVNRCSMLQDIENGRRTEIESINGKLIDYGEKSGINMPYNRSLYLLIKSLETIQR